LRHFGLKRELRARADASTDSLTINCRHTPATVPNPRAPASRQRYKNNTLGRREAEAGILHFRGPEVYLRHLGAIRIALPLALVHPRDVFGSGMEEHCMPRFPV